MNHFKEVSVHQNILQQGQFMRKNCLIGKLFERV